MQYGTAEASDDGCSYGHPRVEIEIDDVLKQRETAPDGCTVYQTLGHEAELVFYYQPRQDNTLQDFLYQRHKLEISD